MCSVYVFDNPLWQPLSRSSLVFLLVLDPLLHTPCISSPSHYLLFKAHAHTNAACSAVIPMLCHLYLVSVSAPYLGVCLLAYCHTSTWPFSSLLAEEPPHFPLVTNQVSLPCNMLLHIQLLYNLPLIINDTFLAVKSGCSLPFLRPWAHTWINHWGLWCMASVTPDLRLPCLPQGTNAPWRYWITLTGDTGTFANNTPKVVTPKHNGWESKLRSFDSQYQHPNHHTTRLC